MLPEHFSLLVLGQGKTGLDVVRWALPHLGSGDNCRVSSVTVYGGGQSRPNDETRALEEQGVSFVFGTETVEGSYDVCVASPGISEFSDFFASARAASDQIMGEPEFAYRLSPERWCAVTGTNGKTTTTSLLNHLLLAGGLDASAVGNIGTVATSRVNDRRDDEWFCAELSSYQLATTEELHPHVGILLNITPDHLKWHRSHENYAQAKLRLFRNMGAGDLAIVDADDEGVAERMDAIRAFGMRLCVLSVEDPRTDDAAFVAEGKLCVRLAGEKITLVGTDELLIPGAHNVANALAASAAALFVGVSADAVRHGLRSFSPLEHRIEPVAKIDGIAYVNDSKATNTDAVLKALTAFPAGNVVLLLGGADKGTALEDFAAEVVRHVRAVVCFGDARSRFLEAFSEPAAGEGVEIAAADHLADALDVARSIARAGEVVLLSPACASFDEFSGFEERGERFKELVGQIAARA